MFRSLIAASILSAPFALHAQAIDPFCSSFCDLIRTCIDQNANFPTPSQMKEAVDSLEKEGIFEEIGNDDLRLKFVGLQGCIEHLLACLLTLGDIADLSGIIHTPMPATPLCTKVDPIDQTLLDESIRNDHTKLFTVQSRALILREYLKKGGKLYVVYPQGGLEKRTPEQQTIYHALLHQYPDSLFDCPLPTDHIDPSQVGASYFFSTPSGKTYLFSIRATQVNDPKEQFTWGLWLGPVEQPCIEKRIDALFNDLLLDCSNLQQKAPSKD